jgi:hypothetical protein
MLIKSREDGTAAVASMKVIVKKRLKTKKQLKTPPLLTPEYSCKNKILETHTPNPLN